MLALTGRFSRIWSKKRDIRLSPTWFPGTRAPHRPPGPALKSSNESPRLIPRHKTGILLFLSLALSAAAEPVHVVYWEKWNGFEEQSAQAVIDRFNGSQNRIHVDYYEATGQIDRKTLIATAGGDPPDIAGLHEQNIAPFADAEALQPLDDFVRAEGMTNEEWLSRYYPVYARICVHGGHIYAGISTPAVEALYWNKTLFREAGLDPDRPPRTLAEFNEYSRLLTKHDPRTGRLVQVGFMPQDPGWWPWIFCDWFGGKLYDGHKVTFATDPKNVAAYDWMQSFTKFYGLDNVKALSSEFGPWASPSAPFFTGKIAMVFQGVWYDNYIHQYKPGLDYGVGPWPENVPGMTDFAMAEADVLTIPRGAKHPKEAWEFIKYVNSSNPNAQSREELQGAELLDFLQVKNSPLKVWSPFFTNHHPHPHIALMRRLSSSPNATCVPQIGIWQEYYREIISSFDRVRLLDATPEEALGYSQKRLDESWERYRRSLERHGQWAALGETAP
jgi:multiple sugar transport system substrate-binding protein